MQLKSQASRSSRPYVEAYHDTLEVGVRFNMSSASELLLGVSRSRQLGYALSFSQRYIRIHGPRLWNLEVDNAPLNKRVWVLQDRLLSSRNIHLAEERYFGSVVRRQGANPLSLVQGLIS
ncbi:hypothetical protein QBC43DRAFT_326185 [Cladorrhinum sp. PSN259]|nr:hypothetical protein QBC43DRAFT_326185 [Cladorrhinum sp. PSN259]